MAARAVRTFSPARTQVETLRRANVRLRAVVEDLKAKNEQYRREVDSQFRRIAAMQVEGVRLIRALARR